MKPLSFRLIFLSSILCCISACRQNTSLAQTNMNTPNTIPLKTQCIGRLLIDLPIEGHSSRDQGFEWSQDIKKLPAVFEVGTFWKMIEAERQSLKNQPHKNEPNLLSAYLKGPSWAVILHRSSFLDDVGYDMERFIWLGSYGLVIRSDSHPNDAINRLEQYTAIFNNLQPRADNEIPSTPGFCIDGATIVGQVPGLSGSPERRVSANIWIKDAAGWEDVYLYIATSENQINNDDLIQTKLEEERYVYDAFKKSDSKLVRKFEIIKNHTKVIGAFKGNELIIKTQYGNGKTHYAFIWQSPGELFSISHPAINIGIDFNDNDAEDPHFYKAPPEDQLLAMWDAVLNSLRWRKGA